LLKAWVCRIRRENFTPTSSSYVCSRHFTEAEMYVPITDTPALFKKRRLRQGAIPSVNLRGAPNEQVVKRSVRLSSTLNSEAAAVEECIAEAKNYAAEQFSEASFLPKGNVSESTGDEAYNVKDLLEKIKRLDKMRFCFKNLSDSDVKNYTGIDRSVFQVIVSTIEKFSPLNMWSGFPVKSICLEDQLLILLLRLRLDLPYFDLASRYSVSETTIKNIVMTYLYAMHEIFFVGMMGELPSQEKNKYCLPGSFGDITNCRIIIDCTEFRIASPRKDLAAASASYSNYKHYPTAKYLIGVAPNGAITFVSNGVPGGVSYKVITSESGVISHLKVIQMINVKNQLISPLKIMVYKKNHFYVRLQKIILIYFTSVLSILGTFVSYLFIQ